MESYLNLKLEEIRENIYKLFSLLYWRNTDNMDMREADIETLYTGIKDTLDFLEEEECETICRIRVLVEQMITYNKELLPTILYKIDEEIGNLYKCLENIWKNISNATTDAATADTTDVANNAEAYTIYKDVNKINLNVHVNKVDVNKIF